MCDRIPSYAQILLSKFKVSISRGDFAPWGTAGSDWRHFYLSQGRGRAGGQIVTGIQGLGARDATAHPTRLRTVAHSKDLCETLTVPRLRNLDLD